MSKRRHCGGCIVKMSAAIALAALLSACAENPPAPIIDKSGGRRLPPPRITPLAPAPTQESVPEVKRPVVTPLPPRGSTRISETTPGASRGAVPARPQLSPGAPYTVIKGDTLYAIAFRLGMDFRELAQINRIDAPYAIRIGQVLLTSPPNPQSAATTVAKAPVSPAKPIKSAVGPSVQSSKAQTAEPTNKTSSKKPKTVTKTSRPEGKTTSADLGPVSTWRWPAAGEVVRSYSSNLHKGIDVAGARGDAVIAVASGSVVYAGTGLPGYGRLLIVKHNDTYLSAYGHNEALLVKEGDRVAVGQRIATMGSSGTDSVKLHFEIRRLGKPVDPLKLLPKR